MKKIYLIATIVALLTGVAVFMFATQLQNEKNAPVQTNLVSVMVAASDIPENKTITADMLVSVQLPAAAVPETAVKDASYLVGKILKYPMCKGEQFLTGKVLVLGSEDNTELSDRIQSGYRAFTVSVDEVLGIAGYLNIGDRVDIIITKTVEGVSETSYLLQDIKIIAVGSQPQNQTGTQGVYSNITLEIPADDCIVLNHNLVNGLAKIVLRGLGDNKTITAPIVKN